MLWSELILGTLRKSRSSNLSGAQNDKGTADIRLHHCSEHFLIYQSPKTSDLQANSVSDVDFCSHPTLNFQLFLKIGTNIFHVRDLTLNFRLLMEHKTKDVSIHWNNHQAIISQLVCII